MLTPEQRVVLRNAVRADAGADAFYQIGDLTGLADYLNAAFSPAFIVWKTSVTLTEVIDNGFDWVRVDNLSIGKARIWEWLFDNDTRTINPSKANVRLGIDETWKGTQADLDVRAAVYVHCKRPATWFERVFAMGAGTTQSPANLVVEGPISTTELAGL